MIGTVKFYEPSRGYGFIACHRDGREFFFHRDNATRAFAAGDRVSFDEIPRPSPYERKRPVAHNVKPVVQR